MMVVVIMVMKMMVICDDGDYVDDDVSFPQVI